MDNTVGLDLSQHNLRAVSLEVKGNDLRLAAVEESQLEDYPDFAAALQNIFNNKDSFPKTRIWSGLDIKDCVLRNMSVPFTDEDQIKQTIKFSCEEVIHDDVDNYLIDHEIIKKAEENSSLMIMAGQRHAIGELLEKFHDCHVDLDGLTCSKLALYNLAVAIETNANRSKSKEATNVSSEKLEYFEDEYVVIDSSPGIEGNDSDNFLVLDIGLSTADIVVGNSEHLEFYRGISTNYDNNVDETFEDAKIRRLLKEIKRTLWAGNVAQAYKKIYIAGGIACLPHIVNLIETEFFCPAELMPVHKAFSSSVKKDNLAVYAQAAGLALMASGRAKIAINFRREEFLKTPLILQIKTPLILSLMLLLCWFSWEGYRKDLIVGYLKGQNHNNQLWQISQATQLMANQQIQSEINELIEQQESNSNDAAIELLHEKSVLPHPSDMEDRPEWLTERIQNRIISVGLTKEKPHALDTLEDFLVHLQGYEDFRLSELTINHNNLNLKGSFSSTEYLTQFQESIEDRITESEKFRWNDMPSAKQNKDGRFYFTLTLNYKDING